MNFYSITYFTGVIIMLLGLLWVSIIFHKRVKHKIPKEHWDKRTMGMAITLVIIGFIIAVIG